MDVEGRDRGLIWDCLNGVKKTTENLSEHSPCPSEEANPASPENKSGALRILKSR
jgi:hypothetical protein